MESAEQVVALIQGNRRDVVLPIVGKQATGASLVEPLDFLRTAEEDPTQDQAMHPLWMGLGVGQGQGRAPGTAEQHPFFDAQVLADALQVFDQIPGGVVFQAGVGGGATATALVEGDDTVKVRIEVATTLRVAASTRATVNEHHWQTFRGTAFIDIERVGVIDSQIVPGMGFDLRVQSLHCALRKGSSHPCGDVYLICRPAS